jgi:hypothetical protein
MDMLEKAKTKHIVAPAINWLIATLYEAEAFGYSHEQAEKVGYKRELDTAIAGLRGMHRSGILVLPGGDYGFAWTPHGTYARDLEHFVELLGFTHARLCCRYSRRGSAPDAESRAGDDQGGLLR